jgi:hypothetical protein
MYRTKRWKQKEKAAEYFLFSLPDAWNDMMKKTMSRAFDIIFQQVNVDENGK